MNNTKSLTSEHAVLLIDGQCLLCNAITHFVVKRDKKGCFRFVAIQSEMGQHLLREGQLPIDDLDTFVMIQSKQYYTKSNAAMRVFRKLDGWWRFLYVFRFVPLAFRNIVYDVIASNRYRLFGKAEVCLMRTPELMDRFLDGGHIQAKNEEDQTDEA